MAVTLTYDDTLSRVRITATGLAAADLALIERSTDQVRWTTVRGAGAVTVTAGVLAQTVDDYEFSPNVVNYYRVRGVETPAITYVGSAGATGNNASLTPAFPAGILAGDLLVTLVSIRNSGTGTVNVPTGWTLILASGNVSLIGRRYVAGDAAPTITFAGGVANADTLSRMAAFRRAGIPAATTAAQLNGSAQNIAYPAAAVAEDGCVVLVAGWKQDDWSSVATLPLTGAVEIFESVSTAGDDAAQVWDYIIQTTATNIAAGSFTVTGGAGAISRGMVVVVPHAEFLNEQTSSITPTLTEVWLKSIPRPFLNRPVTPVLRPDTTVARPARVGIFDVVARTNPIAVSSVRGSRRWTMYVRTLTALDATNTDLLLASGDVLLVQAPPSCTVETGYVAVGDTQESLHPLRPLRKTFTLPMTEVAAPGPDVVGATSTWQTVLNTYATWAALIAANPTWADLLTLVGDPSEVIVP